MHGKEKPWKKTPLYSRYARWSEPCAAYTITCPGTYSSVPGSPILALHLKDTSILKHFFWNILQKWKSHWKDCNHLSNYQQAVKLTACPKFSDVLGVSRQQWPSRHLLDKELRSAQRVTRETLLTWHPCRTLCGVVDGSCNTEQFISKLDRESIRTKWKTSSFTPLQSSQASPASKQ